MLSVSGGAGVGTEEGIQLFSTSTALFVENLGQWSDETVRYGFNGDGVNIAFSDEGLAFSLSQQEDGDALSTQFAVGFDGANEATPVGLAQTGSRFNYFVGDQSSHRSGVAAYATVAYENLYDGIDLHTFGRRDSLKYEFYVSPGADYEQISVSYAGIEGLWLGDDGTLHVETELGELVDDAPYIYQMVEGQEVEVAGNFSLIDNDTYTFEITGEYDPTIELVIDPDLAWGSYLGGGYYDSAEDVAVDSSGNVHVTGSTQSNAWVSGGWFTDYDSPTYAYVAKLSSDGQHLWSTYVEDHGESIALDDSGNVFVTGTTDSEDWVSGGWDTDLGHGYEETADGFVVKLSSSGDHLWSTYIGGTADGVDGGYDYGNAITVDSQGNALVTGTTDSQGWISGGADTSHNGGSDAYVVKLSGSGSHLWSTYLGGSSQERANGVAVDGSGNAVVTGTTWSAGWVSGGWDTSRTGGGYVVTLSESGDHAWSSYLETTVEGVAVDGSGNGFAVGWASSTPSGLISGGWQETRGGGFRDGFVAKFSISDSLPGDLATWQNGYGTASGAQVEDGDADGDGDVDGSDFLNWQRNFSATPTLAASLADDTPNVVVLEELVPAEIAVPRSPIDPAQAFTLFTTNRVVQNTVRRSYRPALRTEAVDRVLETFARALPSVESQLERLAEERLPLQQREEVGDDEELRDSVFEGLVFEELL